MAVYMARTRPCTPPAVYTARVQMYTAVTRQCTQRVRAAYTAEYGLCRPVLTAVYVPRKRRPCTGRAHGPCIWLVYTYTRVHLHGRERARVHGHVRAVSARVYARNGPCRPVYTDVYVPYTRRVVYAAVYTPRVHENVHRRVQAVDTARVHGGVRAV